MGEGKRGVRDTHYHDVTELVPSNGVELRIN